MTSPPSSSGWLVGGGRMGELIRAADWSKTPLGPIASWPLSLRTAVRIMLASRYPMFVWWGEGLTNLYNDAYAPVLGARHPDALGRPARHTWGDIWDVVGPQAEAVLREGRATWNDSVLLVMERHGRPEETYFTFSYSPVPDDEGRTCGVFCACTEDTARVLGERRLKTLHDLGERSLADIEDARQVCRIGADTLAENAHDLPFALIYLLDADGRAARLQGAAGLAAGTMASPASVAVGGADDVWDFERAIRTGDSATVPDLQARFGRLPAGPWREASTGHARVLPLAKAGQSGLPAGFLVAGLSPRLRFDAEYAGFLRLVAGQLAIALANARAYEEERQRAEALAELDRAKTTFFGNVSHEFRTPLALMLGPLEDMLGSEASGAAESREQLAVAHRNALRLLKLVNSLLDFSRIEARRVQASYEPTDLAALTTDLASNFRSACEKASLALRVDCPPLPEPLWVDRDMWEKVVLNLVSNAFKFTLEGEIAVSLRMTDTSAVLQVRDTGVGIPPAELPRLFERFHRVDGTRGRTHEGTGIGLALVQELVKLHGGRIDVASEPAVGTTFTVALPRGSAHLPREHLGGARTQTSTATTASAYVEEALRWLPDAVLGAQGIEGEPVAPPAETLAGSSPSLLAAGRTGRVLVADDNADMRDYVRGLLTPRFDVVAVPDGALALELARRSPPDLVLSDVMMPGLDGFALLRALRSDARTASVPVILLTARAGEEARVEGLEAGADDYLVKPFSARELIARVEARLELARVRRETEGRLREFADTAPAMLWTSDADNRCTFLSRGWYEFTGQTEAEGLGSGWIAALHPDDRARTAETFTSCAARHEPFSLDYRLRRTDGTHRWCIGAGRPHFDEHGAWAGYVGSVIDVHERVEAERALRESQQRLRSIADHVPVMIGYVDRDGRYRFANAQYEDWFGVPPDAIVGRHMRDVIGEAAYEQRRPYIERVMRGEPTQFEGSTTHHRLGLRETEIAYVPDVDADGRVCGFHVRALDITARKRTENALRKQGERLRLLSQSAGIILASDDPDTMLQQVFSKIRYQLGIDAYFNFRVDESGEALRIVSYGGLSEGAAQGIELLSFDEAICGTVARERRPIVATFIQESDDPRVQLVKGHGIRAYACNPLLAGTELLGTLSFASRTRDTFNDDDLAFLETISHYVTAAYRQMRLISQLREADRRKDEFLATLAHELRNPLAPIRTGLQVVRLARRDAPEVEESLAIMERQATQLTRLIDDLLDVSRITRGRLELRRARVELAEVVQSALEAARPALDKARHELSVALPDEPIFLHADLTRLAQVVFNLLGNAAKYTPDGGKIRLAAHRDGPDVVLSVEDDGIGIPADMLDRVFEMFLQIDRSFERGYPGLGLGLTLVKSLVEMHGGSVGVHSDGPDRGSTFTVRLPALAETATTPSAAPDATAASPAARRVLIVDDNADAARLLGMVIETLGNEVRTAHDGFEAIEQAGAFRPDVVLMDIGMPRMDGYEAAREIRARPWGAAMTLVALTGWGQEDDKRKTREAGFDHHLVKPAEPAALEAIFRGERNEP